MKQQKKKDPQLWDSNKCEWKTAEDIEDKPVRKRTKKGVCLNCGKKYKGAYWNQKYCSIKCSNKYNRTKRSRANRDEMLQLNEKCSHEGCDEISTCVLNSCFYCSEHFKIVKKKIKHTFYS